MPGTLKLTFWTVRLARPDGDAVTVPLLEPEMVWIGDCDRELSDAFTRAMQERHLERGLATPLLRYAARLKPEHRKLDISLDAAKDGALFPDLVLTFDAFLSPLPSKGWIGFVPALGVEAVGESADDCAKRVRESISIEFARKKRRLSVHSILSTQWYTGAELSANDVALPAFTVPELKDLAARKLKRLLPDVARELVAKEQRTFGREAELDPLARAVRGKYARSVLLVGPSGAGKTALVEELARVKHQWASLASKRIWEVTAARLVQKLTRGSGWQENLSAVVRELREAGDILFVRSLWDLFEVGRYAGNTTSLAEYLRPALERGEMLLVTECTPEQAAKIDVRAPGYTSMFTQVRVEEPSGPVLESIVSKRAPRAEPDAVREVLRLQKRYSPYSGFPGKPVRFLDALAEKTPAGISRRAVLKRFCEEAGMPEFMVDPDLPLPLDDMEKHFRTNVFGQEAATSTVVDLLASVKAGLARGGKPIASLLFIGPTGVGKTELAKVLAEFMFGSRSRMTRFDMSEFQDLGSVMRLTGEGRRDGLLTGAVRQEPFSVVLFDEVEKAHPVFFDLLLQILGEGRLTDAAGRVADFCSTIIIMTSNLGATELPKGTLGFADSADRRRQVLDHFKSAVESHFRPELFNRLDRIVAFAPLSREDVRRIVDREIKLLRQRPGLRYRDVDFAIAPAAMDWLGERGYDATYGARQLQRAIRDELAVPLSRQLNTYEARQPVEAAADVVEGVFQVKVRGISKKAVETGETMRSVAGQITQHRRRVEQVAEGSRFAQLLSRIELLERKRKKTKDSKWYSSPLVRELEGLTKIRKAIESARADSDFVEVEAVLGILDVDRASPGDLYQLFADVHDRSWSAVVRLYDLLHPTARVGIVAVYGNEKHLETMAKLYQRAAKANAFEIAEFRLWLVKGKLTARPSRMGPPSEGGTLIGIELEVKGAGAALFFEDEGGLHKLRDRQAQWHVYAVRTSRVTWEIYNDPKSNQRPAEPHRKAYYEGKPRRTITPEGVADELYHIQPESADPYAQLEPVIRERFRAQVYEALR